jgi:hypothetical protein
MSGGYDQLIRPFIFEGRATRAVNNRAAACIAAGDGIFENQL